MYLFFDTETSDLPRDFSAPETDIDNWPRVIQIAWVTAESLETASPVQVHLIKPDGFKIAPGAEATHGISTQFAKSNGVEFKPVLESFVQAVNDATTIVAHNIEFDVNVIGAECARLGIPNPIHDKPTQCTMRESTDHCRIPSRRGYSGYKWPALTELHTILFQSDFENVHDASSDSIACMKCFFRLQDLGAM